MIANFALGDITAPIIGNGIGWFDHQWAQAGRLESETVAAIKNIVQVFKPPKINRWYWLTINDYNQKILAKGMDGCVSFCIQIVK